MWVVARYKSCEFQHFKSSLYQILTKNKDQDKTIKEQSK